MSLEHRVLVVAAGLACALTGGCGSEVTLKARYDAIGKVGSAATPAPSVSPEAVEVYYGSSPEGFSLAANELTVEEGYTHRVLGPIHVSIDKLVYGGSSCKELKVGKDTVLDELRKAAAKQGANAVIYASSKFPDADEYGDHDNPCEAAFRVEMEDGQRNVGYGWAVIVAAKAGEAASSGAEAPQADSPATVPAGT
jgi:hypothetical protein